MTTPIVSLSNLHFAWPGQAPLLQIEAFELAAGERLFLRGPSGSGKSTLLGLIAGVLESSNGKIQVLDHDMMTLSGSGRDQVRADHLGVIFQMFNLVPYLSVVQNVILPCRFSKRRLQETKKAGGAEAEAKRLLARLGLDDADLLARTVTELSVGQQQRVAAADADSRDQFIELLSEEAQKTGAALLFVSHDGGLAPLFDRAVDLAEINQATATRSAA